MSFYTLASSHWSDIETTELFQIKADEPMANNRYLLMKKTIVILLSCFLLTSCFHSNEPAATAHMKIRIGNTSRTLECNGGTLFEDGCSADFFSDLSDWAGSMTPEYHFGLKLVGHSFDDVEIEHGYSYASSYQLTPTSFQGAIDGTAQITSRTSSSISVHFSNYKIARLDNNYNQTSDYVLVNGDIDFILTNQ